MRVGEYIHASNNMVHLSGRIIYGLDKLTGEFTDEPGALIDSREVIAISTEDKDLPMLRLSGSWHIDQWDTRIAIADAWPDSTIRV